MSLNSPATVCSMTQRVAVLISLPSTVPTHPNLMKLDPAKTAHVAHLAILQLLFLSSVASTAPRWESSFLRHSTPPAACRRINKTTKVTMGYIRVTQEQKNRILPPDLLHVHVSLTSWEWVWRILAHLILSLSYSNKTHNISHTNILKNE